MPERCQNNVLLNVFLNKYVGQNHSNFPCFFLMNGSEISQKTRGQYLGISDVTNKQVQTQTNKRQALIKMSFVFAIPNSIGSNRRKGVEIKMFFYWHISLLPFNNFILKFTFLLILK